MRKYSLFYLTLAIPFLIYAQTKEENLQSKGYLFNEFLPGSVLMKSGEIETAFLNYDANNKNIAFEKNDKYLVLTNLEDIDTFYISYRKFIPVEKKVYEVLLPGKISLLASYKTKTRPLTATVEHGGASKKETKEVSNTVSDVYLNRKYEPNFSLDLQHEYWLVRGRSFYKANNEKQVAKVFPEKAKEITAFVFDNAIDFKNQNDVVKLISFCNEN